MSKPAWELSQRDGGTFAIDSVCGAAGAAVILRRSLGLLRNSRAVLLDVEPDSGLSARFPDCVKHNVEDRVADLHVWRVSPGEFVAVLSIVNHEPRAPPHHKCLLRDIDLLAHVSVDVQRRAGHHC